MFYFSNKNNKSLLTLTKTKIKFGVILQSCFNGSSELLTNISASIVSMLFNMQLLKFAGENGVAAYGVIMYAGFIFAAIFIGYFIGSAPLFGYNYGAQNHAELKNLLKKKHNFDYFCWCNHDSFHRTACPANGKIVWQFQQPND